MKTETSKLKKLKTKTVYGFRKHTFRAGDNFMDTTTTNNTTTATATTTNTSMIFQSPHWLAGD